MPKPRPTPDDRIRAALWFAERGFGVFSVWSTRANGVCRCRDGAACESPGKHPIPVNGLDAATTDPARIRAMLDTASEPNWGMLPPDGVFALDVDGDGVARLTELEARLGPLPPTLRTDTANGQHIFLRWPESLPRPMGAMFGYVTRWGSGTRRGYIIGPRSVHASGKVYAPAAGTLEIAEMPEAWARAVIEPEQAATGPDIDVIRVSGEYALPAPGYDGPRYDAIRDYVASRYMRGLDPEELWSGVVNVLSPRFARPLSEPELRARFDRTMDKIDLRLGPPLSRGLDDVIAPKAVLQASSATTTNPWPDAIDQAAYHGPVGAVVRAVADITEADPVGILGSLLATIGTCMGHYRYLYQGGAQATNLFVVLVGGSSSGRKGTAGSIAREVMTSAYPGWQDLIVAGLGSGEGLVTHLTPREGHAEHRALVMESEFARLLSSMARDGSTLSPMIRDAWDGVPMGRVLARESRIVKFHHVGILAHITPVELRSRLTSTDAANGFGNRFIWLAVRRTRLLPFPKSPNGRVPADALAHIHAAIVAGLEPGEVTWSNEAAEAWEEFYLEIASRDVPGLYGAMVARAEAQVSRIALLYALVDRSPVIDVEHLAAARALWSYSERSVEHVFGRSTGNGDADALLEYLAEGPLPWDKAKEAIGARRASVLADAVDVLSRLGLAEIVTIPRKEGGRATRWVRKPGQTMQRVQTMQGPAQ